MNGLEVYLYSIEENVAKQMGIGTNMTRGFQECSHWLVYMHILEY